MTRKRRMFAALLPNDQLRDQINRLTLLGISAADINHIHPVPAANLHLTLAFYGEIDQQTQVAISAELAEIATEPFEIRLDQIEFWPKAGILCLVPTEPPAQLLQLAAYADRAKCAWSQQRPQRRRSRSDRVLSKQPFSAHVTLARRVTALPPLVQPAPLNWTVDGVSLVESVPVAGHREYRIREFWPL